MTEPTTNAPKPPTLSMIGHLSGKEAELAFRQQLKEYIRKIVNSRLEENQNLTMQDLQSGWRNWTEGRTLSRHVPPTPVSILVLPQIHTSIDSLRLELIKAVAKTSGLTEVVDIVTEALAEVIGEKVQSES